MLKIFLSTVVVAFCFSSQLIAMEMKMMMPSHNAPIGVMGDHLLMKGKWMLSSRRHHMIMKGNQLNGKSISDAKVLEQANPFSSMPDMPSQLSVVPQEMTMDMLMLSTMYAPSDDLTVMGMAMFMDKEMKLDTYRGMMKRDYLGSFETSSKDLSNLTLIALYRLHQDPKNRTHLHFGLTENIGKNDRVDEALTPMNMLTNMTLPYGMQSSDRSSRVIMGTTNVSTLGQYNVGAQIIFSTTFSKDNWSFGDYWDLNTWVHRDYNEDLSISARMNFKSQDKIEGKDTNIMAPIQTANPLNYGGQSIDLSFGANLALDLFGTKNKKIGVEITLPLQHNLRGLQMKRKWSLVAGYTVSF
jgi:hypothetical protein